MSPPGGCDRIVAATLLTLATLTVAQVQDDGRAKETAAPNPDKRVCRSVEVTGSRMGNTVCHKRSEWAEIDEQNHARAVDTMSQRNAGR